jgi:porin
MKNISVGLIVNFYAFVYSANAHFEQTGIHSENPFSFNAAYISDYVLCNSNYGRSFRAYLGLIDIGVSFNTERAGLWKGGKFYVQIENTHGDTPTADFVNDFQVFSNIENGNHTYLYMAWFKQLFGRLSLLAGIHDLNSEFAISEYAGLFVNSSFGIMPTIAVNVPVPIFPNPGLGIVSKFDATEQFSFQTAVYDGYRAGFQTDSYNLDHDINISEGVLNINEVHFRPGRGKSIYKAGFYLHSGEFKHISDTTHTRRGNYGAYVIIDRELLSISHFKEKELSAFLQLGWAPEEYNFNCLYVGFGLNYSGKFFNNRMHAIGAGIAYGKVCTKNLNVFSDDYSSHETSIELTYSAQITDNITIQPDLQYIINPGALEILNNMLIGLLRIDIGF